MSDAKKVLAYARVSTIEQAEKDLSIPAQLKAIRVYAEANNLIIVKEYMDEGVSAFNETKRLNFEAMIRKAKEDRDVKQILVHDSSRFYRNKNKASGLKGELMDHGVTVIPVSSPYDPTTIDGVWRDTIEDTLSQTTSMLIGKHVVKGMTENASKRDPETGYCYKNGGKPPYGYKIKGVYLGEQRKDNYKSLWEIDPVTGPIMKKMIVDWRIGEGLSYTQIRDRLNELNIPSPSGSTWIDTSIAKMFGEDRLLEYAGHYCWNKAVKRGTKGQTKKDKSEWIIVENAHPALITKEEVEAALSIAKSRMPRTAAASSFNSPWALTGLNLEGTPFFTCKDCGGNMSGRNNPQGGRYGCANYHYRGKKACCNKHTVSRIKLEKNLLEQIESNFGSPEAIESLVKELNSRLNSEISNYQSAIRATERELEKVNEQIEITFTAFEKGLDPDLCTERLNKQKAQRIELENKLEKMKKDQPKPIKIDPRKARDMFNNLKEIYQFGTNEQKRNLFKTYIRRMEYDPEINQVNVVFYAPYIQEKLEKGNYNQIYIADDHGNPQNVRRHVAGICHPWQMMFNGK